MANQVSSALEAIIYVSPDEGKKVNPNMIARIAPSTVKIEEYGYIEGIVRKVSEYPSTRLGMVRVLGNEDLVSTFSRHQSPIAIVVELKRAKTSSGYRWTSAEGPEIAIKAGTFCEANVIIARQRPISLLFPFLK
ncbi:MAG: NHLP bacteriocin system secretion protein [Bacteroidia bacterium]|nr:NHLP bacteriocin system secretion protein [Bacteroidia bacterium]